MTELKNSPYVTHTLLGLLAGGLTTIVLLGVFGEWKTHPDDPSMFRQTNSKDTYWAYSPLGIGAVLGFLSALTMPSLSQFTSYVTNRFSSFMQSPSTHSTPSNDGASKSNQNTNS